MRTSFAKMATIRARIIVLALSGIIGLGLMAGIHQYLNHMGKKYLQLGSFSRDIQEHIQEARLIQHRFLAEHSPEQGAAHRRFVDKVSATVLEISSCASEGEVKSLGTQITEVAMDMDRVFESVVNTTLQADQKKTAMMERLQSIQSNINQAVSAIEYEAAMAVTMGKVMDITKTSLLGELKGYYTLWMERLINIQALLIGAAEEDYASRKQNLDKKLQLTGNNLATVLKTAGDAKIIASWDKTMGLLPEIEALESHLFASWRQNRTLMGQLAEIGSRAIDRGQHINLLSKKKIDQMAGVAQIVFWAVTLASAAVLAILGFALVRSITVPIANAVAMIRDIAEGEGDLTKRLEQHSHDEISEMARWFNRFIDNLQTMIRNVTLNVGKLRQSSGELSGIAQMMAQNAESTSGKAHTVAAASEEMSTNMRSVAGAMNQAAANIHTVAAATEQMTATINEIAQNAEKARSTTRRAVEQARTASVQVGELGGAADEIGKVVETITDISEQVNLLALNATIEAARAGQAGRGFAVVANEIKELARQTADATQEIKQRVGSIQNTTGSTVSQIGAICDVVYNVNEIVATIAASVEEQSVTTSEIAKNVLQATDGIGHVNDNVSQSSTVSGQIAREIEEVTQSAGEMSESSAQTKLSASALAELAQQLEMMVQRFRV